MIFQSSDTQNPLGARALLKREGGAYHLDHAAEQIVELLAKFPMTQMIQQQNAEGVGAILINPQVVDLASMTIVEVGQQFRIPVQGYDDVAAIKAALPELLPQLEDKLVQLPSGQRLEVVVGVSGQRPRSSINLEVAAGAPTAGSTNLRTP